jgi:hypothetical protein
MPRQASGIINSQRAGPTRVYDRAVNRNLRVVFSKAGGGEHEYHEVARGAWFLGRDPVLTGEAIPPEVLKGIEKQTPAACDHAIRYARADTLYAMDFEAFEEDSLSGGSAA